MNIRITDLSGVLPLGPCRHDVHREFFSESWSWQRMAEIGIAIDFVQDTRTHEELGWHPSVTLEDGLRKTDAGYLDNEAWWTALQNRKGVGDQLGVTE